MSESTLEEITSLISIPMTVCNVPDPVGIETKFIYNFYVKNEDVEYHPTRISEYDPASGVLDKSTIDAIEARERGALRARVPRYIVINITPNTAGVTPDNIGEIPNSIRERIIDGNYNIEGRIENSYYASSVYTDSGFRGRIQRSIYRISSALLQSGSVYDEISDEQIALQLNRIMSDEIDGAAIVDALSDNEIKGIEFVNQVKTNNDNRVDQKADASYPLKTNVGAYKQLTTLMQRSNPFSSNFRRDLLGTHADDADINPFLVSPIELPEASLVREIESFKPVMNVLITTDPEPIRRLDLSSETEYAGTTEPNFPRFTHIGYIVEKYGKTPDGSLETFPQIVSLNTTTTQFIDTRIKYGHTYFYKARQLYIATFPQEAEFPDETEIKYVFLTCAIASGTPAASMCVAKEKTPPAPPSILFAKFMYDRGRGVRLDWAPPINPARDIKKYQIFRRLSIKDPFEIIAEYDFTDPNYTQFVQSESIDPSLVSRSTLPQYFHMDDEFTRESTYIYCVASVDAHGFLSNYGTQVEVKFNRYTNKIETRKISQSGAPRAYPNYYIDPTELDEIGSDRLIEDVIKDSGHGRLRIYFNPDAYKVTSDTAVTDESPIVLSSEKGVYKIQIINLDRQISKNLSIAIQIDTGLSSLF